MLTLWILASITNLIFLGWYTNEYRKSCSYGVDYYGVLWLGIACIILAPLFSGLVGLYLYAVVSGK